MLVYALPSTAGPRMNTVWYSPAQYFLRYPVAQLAICIRIFQEGPLPRSS